MLQLKNSWVELIINDNTTNNKFKRLFGVLRIINYSGNSTNLK